MSFKIDPEIITARKRQAAVLPVQDLSRLSTADARSFVDRAAMFFCDGRPELADVRDYYVPGEEGHVHARVYQAEGARTDAALLFVHGGGWFACSVDTHDRLLRLLASESGLPIVAIDYRLAPEHPWPAALNDCRTAWRWLQSDASPLRDASTNVVVAGDSAGATLALSLAVDLKDQSVRPAGLTLLYGCFAPGLQTDSRRLFGDGSFGLTGEQMDWFWASYLGSAADNPPALAAPLRAELTGLPPVFLGIAEYDVVADDSRLLFNRLKEAGTPVRLTLWSGTTHAFLQMSRDVGAARTATVDVAMAALGMIAG